MSVIKTQPKPGLFPPGTKVGAQLMAKTPNRSRPGMRNSDLPPTQKDVAKALGLAQSTVSMALRDDPSIPEARRREIQRAAEAMGYRLNPAAAALAHHKAIARVKPVDSSLAWLNFWPDSPKLRDFREFDLYWKGAQAAAEKLGYRLDEFKVDANMPMKRLEQILITRGVNGIILPPGPLPDDWRDFNWDAFSVVRLSAPARADDLNACTVMGNQLQNAILAHDSIRAKGYKRIAFVGALWRDRLFGAGYLWAQQDMGGEGRLAPLFLPTDKRKDWQVQFDQWLADNKPDAILTDLPEVPQMLRAAGHTIPGEIGLASMSVLDTPIDSGINQNAEEIGRVGAYVLQTLMHDNARGMPLIHREILVRGSWVDGSSLPDRSNG